MRILVTGASGFLGRNFCAFLRGQGAGVYTLGRSGSGENHISCGPEDFERMVQGISDCSPDAVAHLAGAMSASRPSDFYVANTAFAANLFSALDRSGNESKPVLIASSAAEYGFVPAGQMPISETLPEAPINHYGMSKYAQTRLAKLRAAEGKPVIIARIFNLAGPGMGGNLVIQSFVEQINAIKKSGGRGSVCVGNLATSRDYLWISDAVKLLWALLQNPEARGSVTNVCSGVPLAVRDILDVLIQAAGADIKVEVDSSRLRPNDMPVHFGSNQKMKRLTGLEPEADVLKNLPALVAG